MAPGSPRVALTTLGCKVNRADSNALLARLGEAIEQVPFDAEADVYIINSCTVTATADRQSRQLINQARRRNPRATVVLTGCLAAVPSAFSQLAGADRIIPLRAHDELAELVRAVKPARISSARLAPVERCLAPARRRPFLKVQDGCPGGCSYCIVPLVRGPSCSTSPDLVESGLRELAALGFAEVVLTGIHLGLYGHDLTPPTSLVELLRRVLGLLARLRLSSLEPLEVSPALVDLLAESPALCSHLHLPLQSGDDEVLAAMGRPYRVGAVLELLGGLRARLPHLALGADLITGFPGESAAHFAGSLRLVEESPLTHLHVFPFSPRPGTAAAVMAGAIPREVARVRAAILRQAGGRKTVAFAGAQVGSRRSVLVERRHPREKLLVGLTENYLRVLLPGDEARIGQLVQVRIVESEGPLLRGRIIDPG